MGAAIQNCYFWPTMVTFYSILQMNLTFKRQVTMLMPYHPSA